MSMKKQEQIDALRTEIERIKEHIGLPYIYIHQGNLNHSEKPNSCEPDYTHLLPEGYEFCAEQDAEKWVKVEMNPDIPELKKVGYIWNNPTIPSTKRYRPIRPIQYHISVHEAVTAEPDPYQVDWSNAPEWADVHCFDANGKGNWYGVKRDEIEWYRCNIGNSEFTLPSGLDWKQSKRLNPKLK